MSLTSKKPDFFIVGAPKCGTSFIHHHLRQHPEIFLPELKEIYFFGKDLHFKVPRMTKEAYLNLFLDSKTSQLTGDATATNLRSATAASEIKAFNPEARIIIMLRNPVDMAYALHSELCYNGNENILEFEDALQKIDERKKGIVRNKLTCPVECLDYIEMGKFHDQVKRYLDIFNAKKVKIILFDDFKKDPGQAITDVLSFLEASTDFAIEIDKVNPNKTTRSHLFRDLLKHLPEGVKEISRKVIPSKELRKKLFEKLWQINSQPTDRKPLSDELKQRLQKEFKHDVDQLEQLIKRDLSSWNK